MRAVNGLQGCYLLLSHIVVRELGGGRGTGWVLWLSFARCATLDRSVALPIVHCQYTSQPKLEQ